MMKTKLILVLSIAIVSISSCKKYPDGPALSLRSKSERVANNWKIAEAKNNGNDVTSDYQKYELNLTKNGDASLTAKYIGFASSFELTTSGKWVFVSDKEKISFDFDNDSADGVYTILKLKEKEMWLLHESDNVELHFVPQ